MMVADYLTFQLLIYILWGIMGLAFMTYGVIGGYGMGASILFPFMTTSEADRVYFYSHIRRPGFFGDGWLFVSLGLTFLFWPVLLFASLSVFRPLIFVVVGVFFFRMILRGLRKFQQIEGVEIDDEGGTFYEKIIRRLKKILTDLQDNSFLHKILSGSSLIQAALFGVILGNVMVGTPFQLEGISSPSIPYISPSLSAIFEGNFLDLISPFALSCAIICILMMVQQGVLGLAINADNALKERLLKNIHWTTLVLLMIFSLIGLYSSASVIGFKLVTPVVDLLVNGEKEVVAVRGYWGMNYDLHPWMRIAPAFGYLGLISAWVYTVRDEPKMAFISNSIAIAGIIGTAGVSIFPFLLPSSTHLSSGLTVWDVSSSYWFFGVVLSLIILALPSWIRKLRNFFCMEWIVTND